MSHRSRPNVIVVLCDDLGYGDVGVLFQNGLHRSRPDAPTMTTPNLDRMAADGVVLEGMYCPSPVCAPSRASLLTGTTQGHADLRDNAFDRSLEDTDNLATVLGHSGYATAAIGKWGLQGQPTPDATDPDGTRESPQSWPAYPTKRGFDDFFGYVRHRDGHEHYPKEGLYRGPRQVWHNDREVSADLDRCYTTDLFTARAKQWIVDHRSGGSTQPFFLYLAYDTPHAVTELPACAYPDGGGLRGGLQWLGEPGAMITTATGEPDSYVHPDYADATFTRDGVDHPWPDVYRRYATAVRRIDDCVGDLLELLRDLAIDEETLVIFTSDNGPSIESYLPQDLRADFFESYGPFDGVKRDCWEGGVRVGALVRAPGIVPPGRSTTNPVQFHDLLPTFAELAGVVPPARVDGVSLVPLLTGRGEQPPSTIYVEYAVRGRTPDYAAFGPGHRNRLRGQMQLIRQGDYVGVRYDIKDPGDPFEIYDVMTDPKQEYDLAGSRPDLQRELQNAVPRLRMPHREVRRPYDGVAAPGLTDAKGRDAGKDRDDAEAQQAGTAVRRTYTGEHAWVPLLDGVVAAASTTVNWPHDTDPVPAGTTAMLYTARIAVPAEADYRFTVQAGDGFVLRVHDARVLESPAGPASGDAVAGTIRLAAGSHPLRLYVLGAEVPTCSWSATDCGL